MQTRDLLPFLMGLLPSILTGLVLYYWQRKQAQRDKVLDARSKARKEEALLSIDLEMANLKLTLATAIAVKGGKINGEMEEGLQACKEAKVKWVEFMNAQAKEHLLK